MSVNSFDSLLIRSVLSILIIGSSFQFFYSFSGRMNYSVLAETNSTKDNSSGKGWPNYSNIPFPQQAHVNIVVGAALKRDKAFQPNPAGVIKNGTVTWTNEDSVTHTVTSGNGINDPTMGKEFDSGLMGKSFTFMFSKSGIYSYFCQVHPTMVGKLIVR
jgi:plastocyanin